MAKRLSYVTPAELDMVKAVRAGKAKVVELAPTPLFPDAIAERMETVQTAPEYDEKALVRVMADTSKPREERVAAMHAIDAYIGEDPTPEDKLESLVRDFIAGTFSDDEILADATLAAVMV
jgi:hypothetical protein